MFIESLLHIVAVLVCFRFFY